MNGFAEYEQYDALGLADLVRRREVTPAELLEAAIDDAIARKPKGHDFVIDRRRTRPAVTRHMSVTGG